MRTVGFAQKKREKHTLGGFLTNEAKSPVLTERREVFETVTKRPVSFQEFRQHA
jgi:hypothetical protein